MRKRIQKSRVRGVKREGFEGSIETGFKGSRVRVKCSKYRGFKREGSKDSIETGFKDPRVQGFRAPARPPVAERGRGAEGMKEMIISY
jgi:hypothetical protein